MEELKYVVDNSTYVSIDYNKLDEFVDSITEVEYKHWYYDTNLDLNEKERILLVFIIESMNFCFWKKPKWKIDYKGEIIKGSNALFYSIIKEVESNKEFLNIDNLHNMTFDDLKKVFNGVEGEIPFFENRYNNFKETIEFIYNNKNFYDELFNIKTDTELLSYITSNLKHFDDKSSYKGKVIHFNKRATLLANDLFYLSDTIHNNLKNMNNLTGCADYAIPRLLRDLQILIYTDDLKEMIDNEIEIDHDSEMEIEIRANMLYVIELIKDKLSKKDININSVELDNVIWNETRTRERISNSHHTVTIFY